MNCMKCDIAKRLRQETDNLQLLREVVGSNPIITPNDESSEQTFNTDKLESVSEEMKCVAST